MDTKVQIATTDADIECCWEVVEALRPHLKKENFVSQARRMMDEGYLMAYVMENGKAASFAGFREMEMFYSGKIIYIDDLSTLPEYRGKGYGGILLDYIHRLARDKGKEEVHLDSGYQRNTAHRLYLNKGYVLAAHHLILTLNK